jgi:hypothetical protein
MTNQYQKLKDLINEEIAFHSEIENPWYWQWICKLFGRHECHIVLLNELRFLKKNLEMPYGLGLRRCGDCGEEFVPVDSLDWWCKTCLIKRYNSIRPKQEPQPPAKEPEPTFSGPGGS